MDVRLAAVTRPDAEEPVLRLSGYDGGRQQHLPQLVRSVWDLEGWRLPVRPRLSGRLRSSRRQPLPCRSRLVV